MNKYSIYINGLPCRDNTPKGKIYNSNFLLNIKINSFNRIRIYISKNIRHKDQNFEDYLYEFNPADIFDEINEELKNRKKDFLKAENNIYKFNDSSRIASDICKSRKLRLRLASELDRYSNKLTMCETYDLIYRLSLIYSSKIKELRINYGIFYETPHSFWDTILVEVMKSNKCKTIILTRTLFDNLLLDRENLNNCKINCDYCSEEINKLYKYIKNISSLKNNLEIKSFWNSYNQKNTLKLQKSNRRALLEKPFAKKVLKPIYEFFLKLNRDVKTQKEWRDTSEVFYKKNSFIDKIKANIKRFNYNLIIAKREDIYKSFITSYEKQLLPKKVKKKYIYYPLPAEPERTTVPEGGENWFHLLSTITTVRSLVPDNIPLLVKEHPDMFRQRQPILGYRSKSFYNEITKLSNTYLLNHELSSPMVIKSAKVVIASSGSSGFEAFLNGTSVITLGSPWYKDIKGILNASSKQDLSNALKFLLTKENPKLIEIKKNLSDFLDKKTFIYGSTIPGMDKILHNFNRGELENHSSKSAKSLICYINEI